MSVSLDYLSKLKNDRTRIKCFLVNGTMLEGSITECDEESIVLGRCLIMMDKIISITPPIRA